MSSASAPTEDELQTAVAVALHAPSIRNTQPWSWVRREAGLDLHYDERRRLLIADPDRRGMHLSCGASLQHAVLALQIQGLESDVVVLPDPADPTFLAAVRVADRIPLDDVPEWQHELIYAVLWRKSESRAMTDLPLEANDVEALTDAAREEGARLDVVSDRPRTQQLMDLAESVHRARSADPSYSDELARWLRTDRWAEDGIPPGQDSPSGPVRIVVSSLTDDPRGWTLAGAALARVLLTATAVGLSAPPLSPLLESAAAREEVRRILDVSYWPQAMLHIGYLDDQVPPLPLTPRRDLDEVLVEPGES